MTTVQSQLQNLQENLGKVTTERENLKKDAEAKALDIQEKAKTITQVKKIGRRYKTQYEELKVQHDKVNGWHLYCDLFQSAVQLMIFVPPFTHTFTHQRYLATMQGTSQLVRRGLGVLLTDTST